MAIYGQRWAIETDLRTLKPEHCLDKLTCFDPDMMAEEIDMGIAANRRNIGRILRRDDASVRAVDYRSPRGMETQARKR